MSKRARNIMANLHKGESPGPIVTVPQWFNQACASTSRETEPPAKKICARRSLQFNSPVKKDRSSISANNDEEPNFLDLEMRPIENGSANSTNFEKSQTTSHCRNTDGDFFTVSTIEEESSDSIGAFVTLTNMPANSDDLYLDDHMNAEMIDTFPNTEMDSNETSEGEKRAQSEVLQQSEDSLQEEAFQAEENVEEQILLETTPEGLVTPNTAGIANSPQQPGKGKKRVACPAQWKANMRKKALNTGKSHISSTGKERKARELGPGCTEKCNRCKTRLTLEQREEIRKAFWDIGNHQRQLDYVCSRIRSNTPKKKYAEPGTNGKEIIKIYFFQVNGKEVRVCKKTFMDTLSICDSWLKTATKNSRGEMGIAPPDMRGKHTKSTTSRKNKDLNDSVREHINLIPRIESHYTRSRTKREYVENGLSIEELYRRYLIWVAEKNLPAVASARQYRKIFNEEFNIGFFMPKSDQCALCSKWKHASTEEKSKMARQYALHTENRNISRNLKASDKLNSEKEENFGKLCVASFDMQKILSCPKSEVADFYYKSKINLYNFTIFDMAPRLGTCYIWNETEGKKGSSEVASGVYNFIDKKQKEGTVEFVFYSDNPTSQNKNRYVFSMYHLASTKYRVKITHRFLEVGHTQMEVDSMHAAIEKSVKKKEIFSIEEWYSYILDAKKNGKHRNDPAVKYTIEKVGETYEILNFKPLVMKQNWDLDTNKNKIQWMKIREVHFDPEKPGIVSIKYSYNSNPIEVNVKDKRGRPINLTTYTPGSAYDAKFPLAENKIKDLKDLIRSGAIPSKYHEFYNSIIDIGAAPSNDHLHCSEDCADCCDNDVEQVETVPENQ